MAELSELESKLGEVMGLAQAAQLTARTVAGLVDDDGVKRELDRVHDESGEVAERCRALTDGLDGRKTAIADKARETKREAQEMMKTYLGGDDVDALDGFEFMIMSEAAELGHVEIVEAMNGKVRLEGVDELIAFVKPIEEGHVRYTRETALRLARAEAG